MATFSFLLNKYILTKWHGTERKTVVSPFLPGRSHLLAAAYARGSRSSSGCGADHLRRTKRRRGPAKDEGTQRADAPNTPDAPYTPDTPDAHRLRVGITGPKGPDAFQIIGTFLIAAEQSKRRKGRRGQVGIGEAASVSHSLHVRRGRCWD